MIREKDKEPCKELDYCPYGCLVEYFPLHGSKAYWNDENLKWIEPDKKAASCRKFGHDCPYYYVAEDL